MYPTVYARVQGQPVRQSGMSDDQDTPQGQSAYRQILSEIQHGRLLPGARLRETELAGRLGISRTPVREAIRQLESEGLVTHLPRQGATVRGLDHAEVIELYEMRAVLEGMAARLAARMALPVEIEELEALNAQLAVAGRGAPAQEANRLFHRTLIDAARNRYLLRSVNGLQKTLLILGPTTLAESERQENAVTEHAQVIAALIARDGDEAERAMRRHVEAALKARIRTMRLRNIPLEDVE